MVKSILFIAPGDKNHQSTMHRCYLHSEEFNKKGVISKVISVNKGKSNNIIYLSYKYFQNLIKSLFFINFYEFIIFHRRKDPLAVFLTLYSKLLRKRIIYDLDDAIYLNQSNFVLKIFNWMIKNSDLIICSNNYLYSKIREINPNVKIISSPVYTEHFFKRKRQKNKKFMVGWLGPGEDHYIYLSTLFNLLKRIKNPQDYKLKLVSSLGSKKILNLFSKLKNLEVDYGNKEWMDFSMIPKEINDFDVSVLPLINDKWSKGKQSIKLLESMSMEIPVMGSNIGYNKVIISEGVNGFLYKNSKDFIKKLEFLRKNEKKRLGMGRAGRKFIEENYSLKKLNNDLLNMLKKTSLSDDSSK